MKSFILKWFIGLGVALLLYGCKDNPESPARVLDPPDKYMSATMPLSINNEWTYVDSTYNTDGSVRRTDMSDSKVTAYSQEDEWDWWTLSYGNSSPVYYSVRRDSVYYKSESNGVPKPELFFLPPQSINDTVRFTEQMPFNDDEEYIKVYSLSGKFKTPVGTFDSVYVYETYDSPIRRKIYFKPYLGIVGIDTYYNGFYKGIYIKSRLIYYKINKLWN